MLRTSTNSVGRVIPACKSPFACYALKNYTTSPPPDNNSQEPNNNDTNTPKQETKPSFSERLGGSGRGKIMLDVKSDDPFLSLMAKFSLQNENNRHKNNNRNGNFSPRNPKRTQQGGYNSADMFADANADKTSTQNSRDGRTQPYRNNSSNDNNRNQNRNASPNNRRQFGNNDAASAEGSGNRNDNYNNRRQFNRNNETNTNVDGNVGNNNDNNKRRQFNNTERKGGNNMMRQLNFRKPNQQPQEVRTGRATTFINKDIDWSSIMNVDMVKQQDKTESTSDNNSSELLLKDSQGDYDRYLSVGSDLTWSNSVLSNDMTTLVGSNPSFDIDQKLWLMAAVSGATGGSGSASVRK